MKTKIVTMLDEELVHQLKDRSVREDRPMSEIVQDALQGYLHAGTRQRELRIAAVDSFCSSPFQLSGQEIQQILAQEYHEG